MNIQQCSWRQQSTGRHITRDPFGEGVMPKRSHEFGRAKHFDFESILVPSDTSNIMTKCDF